MTEEIEKFPFMAEYFLFFWIRMVEYVLSTLEALMQDENSLFGDQPKI